MKHIVPILTAFLLIGSADAQRVAKGQRGPHWPVCMEWYDGRLEPSSLLTLVLLLVVYVYPVPLDKGLAGRKHTG